MLSKYWQLSLTNYNLLPFVYVTPDLLIPRRKDTEMKCSSQLVKWTHSLPSDSGTWYQSADDLKSSKLCPQRK